MKILIIEDDKDISEILKIYLEMDGYDVLQAKNGYLGLELLDESIDLIILDLMLPDIDGLKVCRKIREDYNTPIIMITAKTADNDKILGLSYGADDYITKPFNPLEVVARVKALIRRNKEYDRENNQIYSNELVYRELILNIDANKVFKNGVELKLTPTEYKILKILLENKGKALSVEKLFEMLWKDEYFDKNTNTITVHIRNLREKLEDYPEKPDYIKTVWGVGYIVE